jgi:hypothetical protein
MAKHENGTPAVIVNPHGKGKAVYLNFVPGNGPSSIALMNRVLELAGVERTVTLSTEQGPAIGYECFLFERGPVKYLGVLRDLPPQPAGGRLSWHGPQFRHAGAEKEMLTVRLPGKHHVYDVRAGKYMGRVASVSSEMAPAQAKVFGLLPYRVRGVALRGLKPQYRPGDHVRCEASVAVSEGDPGDHVLRVEVCDPDGRPATCYRKNALAVSGRHQDSLPMALNDKLGVWTLRVTDVTSKISETVRFAVSDASTQASTAP